MDKKKVKVPAIICDYDGVLILHTKPLNNSINTLKVITKPLTELCNN